MLTPWSYFRAGKNEEEGGCNDHALDFSLAGASRFRGGSSRSGETLTPALGHSRIMKSDGLRRAVLLRCLSRLA